MPVLHNRISNDELKARMLAESEPRTTISFYKYFTIVSPQQTRDALYQMFTALGIFGRVYLAHEGINAQISVPQSKVETFRQQLYAFDPSLDGLRLNIALEDDGKSFWVLRMKVRDRIVADGIDDPSFDASNVGAYLKAAEVNAMLDDPDAIFIDMRNHYEYEVGHFENALEIPADTFREQLPKAVEMLREHADKKIVMYCTGGIRCEKASAWMKHNGFNKVWHIEGGIIEYARRAREQGLPVRFIGKNFVFDERMGERISDEVIAHCHQCGALCDSHTNCKNAGCHLLFIQCPLCASKFNGCCSEQCCEELALPEDEQRRRRAGREKGNKIFNKSRGRLNSKLGIPDPTE
ncbi:rhodanese-related sulfurtransferase [Salmonella enterica subsp. arizonae]|uniref:tRNA uridine(34) hydroxylase n=1 Tax=Salmonella enterica subsp. arizonae TaxID=59203 RepID=A0A5Y3PZ98_SALER|nr:rhodanese-related sulfurtransferase [Salmonella enterica]EAV7065807.1 rhodanese-related sulfurtransferase [Salmonella enterica subsp. arizonae serovar 63:z36:-]EBH9975297.1 rhodanese-related sulfurtransferase [Salmonella enterica subsp. arizonae serovar 40:z36:-]EBP3362455.1 rhodanese-related sulfurtransferase [Salmonella enterica subsp. enterica]ECE6851090.1 rhodanese-related sulfurtransferase [Salmonella enterica subsp. arizonae]ECU8516202.1 rhodanese-related sulfurtransferase [Salmonella